jgi:hypothetical protein
LRLCKGVRKENMEEKPKSDMVSVLISKEASKAINMYKYANDKANKSEAIIEMYEKSK